MTVLVESAHDAQILPPGPGAGKATITAWTAYLACDADTRTKHATYRDIAAQLEVRRKEVTDDARNLPTPTQTRPNPHLLRHPPLRLHTMP